MTINKCDRCDQTFPPPKEHNEYFIGKIEAREGDNIPISELDICPACASSFKVWFEKANTTGADWDENKD